MDKNYAFIFDIGRVLLDFEFDRAMSKLEKFSPYGAEYIKEKIFTQEEGKRLIADYESGKIDSFQFYNEIKRLTEADLDFEVFAEIWSDIFTENENIVGFLRKVERYPKAIISNTCPLHWERRLADSSIGLFFEKGNIIKSYEAGVRKPDVLIYDLAKKILPADSEIIYFDDVEEYVEMASALGIRGVKYDCRIDDINQVLEENGIFV